MISSVIEEHCSYWGCSVVVINTPQLQSTMSKLEFLAGSTHAGGILEIGSGGIVQTGKNLSVVC